jgi:hypothetical protein
VEQAGCRFLTGFSGEVDYKAGASFMVSPTILQPSAVFHPIENCYIKQIPIILAEANKLSIFL